MKYITGTLDFALNKRSVITLGKFDGLHRGHDKLINRILEIGKEGFQTVVFTFDVSPMMRLSNAGFRTVLTNRERRELAQLKQIDCLLECPFVPEIMNMDAADFIKEVLVKQLKAAYIVVGPDFHFGRGRGGNPGMLAEYGQRYNYQVEVLDKVVDGDRAISSSYVREEILAGNIEKANELLGYPYFISSQIIHGKRLGRTIGMPTINQIPGEYKLLPPFGVYASKTYVDGSIYKSVSNIGVKPTVGDYQPGVETYLFDCDKNLYGLDAKVELYHYQRPEMKFASVEELKKQLHMDQQLAQQFFEK